MIARQILGFSHSEIEGQSDLGLEVLRNERINEFSLGESKFAIRTYGRTSPHGKYCEQICFLVRVG